MNRPLVWVALGFVGGAVLAARGVCPGVVPPLLLCGIGVFVLYLCSSHAVSGPLGVLLCFLGAGALLFNARAPVTLGDPLSRHLAAGAASEGWLEGVVRSADLIAPGEEPNYTRFLLDADRAAAPGATPVETRGGVVVRWTAPGRQLYPGERVRVSGRWSGALSHVNPGVENVEDVLRRSGVHTLLRASGANAVSSLAPPPWWRPTAVAMRLRRHQADRLARAVPESALPFVLAVWLGERSGVAQAEYDAYIVSGTAHILAISGIHVGIVYLIAAGLLRHLPLGPRARSLVAIALMFAFALMGGARISALRAATMFSIYALADAVGRERDAPTALSISALLFLLRDPAVLFDCAFQLSFLSVASILLFVGPLERGLQFLPWSLRHMLAGTLAAQILPLPLAIRYFHVLPAAAPLANLVVVPLLGVALWLSFLTGLTASVWVHGARLFGHALYPVVGGIRAVTSAVAASGVSYFNLTSPPWASVLCYWAAVGLLCAAVRHGARSRYLLGTATVLAVAGLALWRPVSRDEAVFLDVGHGDAVFVRSPEGKTLLVDGGDRSRYVDAGARLVAPFLWANGVSKLDCIALSHPDNDHAGGLVYVVEHFRVGEVLLGPCETDRACERALLEACARRGVPVRRLAAGDTLRLGSVAIEVLHPSAAWASGHSINDGSLVLRAAWRGISVLLTGDIEQAGEGELRRRGCAADVMKVPHHGSDTSSTPAFIEAVAPRCAVVSTGGASGREGLDASVPPRYTGRGVPLFRTDTAGAVRVRPKDGELSVECERARRGYPAVPYGR